MPPRRAWPAVAALLALAACTPVEAAPAISPSVTIRPVLRVMPLGDSITQGVGSSTGAGYRLPLWDRMAGHRVDFVGSQARGAVADPDHEGHSGYMIDQLKAGVDRWLATARPDVVLLHAGINDLDRGEQAHAADRLIALADRIAADRPHATVLVLGLIPTTGGLQAEVQIFNTTISTAPGHRYHYAAPPALTPGEMADRLHPNDQGYQRIAEAFYAAMNWPLSVGNTTGGSHG